MSKVSVREYAKMVANEYGEEFKVVQISRADFLAMKSIPSARSGGDSDMRKFDSNYKKGDEEVFLRVSTKYLRSQKMKEIIEWVRNKLLHLDRGIKTTVLGDTIQVDGCFWYGIQASFKINSKNIYGLRIKPILRRHYYSEIHNGIMWEFSCLKLLWKQYQENQKRNREKVFKKYFESHVAVYKRILPVLKEKAKKSPLLVYGRDCWYLHQLMEDRGIPHLYLEGVSRAVIKNPRLAKWITHKIGRHIGSHHRKNVVKWLRKAYHVDTGFSGSIPRGVMRLMAKHLDFYWENDMDRKNKINYALISSGDRYKRLIEDWNPEREVADVEHSPKLYLRSIMVRRSGKPVLKRSKDYRLAYLLLEKIRERLIKDECAATHNPTPEPTTTKIPIVEMEWDPEYPW